MAIATEDEKRVNLWPYVVLFGLVYLAANAVGQAIFLVFDAFD